MKNLQLSGTENVWIDEENATVQFWGNGKMVEYPIEFTLRIMDFFNDNQNNILASIDHFQMEDRDEGWEGDDE